jgi:hypothetical protein
MLCKMLCSLRSKASGESPHEIWMAVGAIARGGITIRRSARLGHGPSPCAITGVTGDLSRRAE